MAGFQDGSGFDEVLLIGIILNHLIYRSSGIGDKEWGVRQNMKGIESVLQVEYNQQFMNEFRPGSMRIAADPVVVVAYSMFIENADQCFHESWFRNLFAQSFAAIAEKGIGSYPEERGLVNKNIFVCQEIDRLGIYCMIRGEK
jgi:hypothetical protein